MCGWVESLAKSLSTEDFACFISICWAIWWNRNRALMEQTWLPEGDLLSFTTNYLASFQQINTSSIKLVPKTSPACWSPPGFGEVKLNFDRAIFASSSEVGLGVIARNSAGVSIWWKSVRKQGLFELEMLEAFTAREAILLARQFGWRRIILERDCANLYFKLSSSSLIALLWDPSLETLKV
ncbi:UNVERIFIED_CONTAM: hypothetical protein Slati_2137600 [Sesamum latifolium]|uniref:RNase H type-1 domain-containing protein n=1 Tax=Sesamum latifolium TaxID=2727402 RepID=A0AAW2WT71_9LAMI